jgi:hypothetical protein
VASDWTAARFPHVPAAAGHYESYYLKACHPDEPLGLWIRYTVHKRPGKPAKGSLWCTVFEAGGPHAAKVTLPEPAAPEGELIRIGEASFAPGRVVGEALDCAWELTFEDPAEPFLHLPRTWMYRAKLPRTKTLSPWPQATFSGRVRVGEREIVVDRWPGMVGHNWGAEHAERWIWMHGTRFAEAPDAVLDVAIGRVRLGPVTTPWVGNGLLLLDGERIRLGGLGKARATRVEETPQECRFALAGRDVEVEGRVGAPRERFVCWVYADPDGPEHHTANCSIADMELVVRRRGRPERRLRVEAGAAYELGMRERDHGYEAQPFPDG